MFIIPGQKAKPPREKTPDSPPLKKPPTPTPIDEPTSVKVPPPIPPKTYTKLVFPVDEGGAKPPAKAPDQQVGVVVVQTEPKLEPKQSNIERARGVHFHPDTKVPALPPPIPARERGQSSAPNSGHTATAKKEAPPAPPKDIAKETTVAKVQTPVSMAKTVALTSSMGHEEEESSCGGSLDEIVAIVDENGILVGELVPSPVDKQPPKSSLHDDSHHQHYQLRQSPPNIVNISASCSSSGSANEIAQCESEC